MLTFDVLDKHVQTMTLRVDLAIDKTVYDIFTALDAATHYVNAIKSRGLCVLSGSTEMIEDVADEARANMQQLTSLAALYQWANVSEFKSSTIADTFVFNSIAHASWLPFLAPVDFGLKPCLRVVPGVIEPSLCDINGQGLTTFNPLNSDQQNVIHMVLRDEDSSFVDWVTKDDICLVLTPECVSAGQALTFNITQDDNNWRIAYCVINASMGAHVTFCIKIWNVVIRQCNVQVL